MPFIVTPRPFAPKMPSNKNAISKGSKKLISKFCVRKLSKFLKRRFEPAMFWPSVLGLLAILFLIWFIIYMAMVDYQLYWLYSCMEKTEMAIQEIQSKMPMAPAHFPNSNEHRIEKIPVPSLPPPLTDAKRNRRSVNATEKPGNSSRNGQDLMADFVNNFHLQKHSDHVVEGHRNKFILALGILFGVAILLGIGIWLGCRRWKRQRAERNYSLHNNINNTDNIVWISQPFTYSALHQRGEQQQPASAAPAEQKQKQMDQ